VVRRQATAATFAAVHEPYEGAPALVQVRRLAEAAGAIALVVEAPGYTDYVCVGFDDREHTLLAGGAAFVFTVGLCARQLSDGAEVRALNAGTPADAP
jgi:hypothetical protein